jgi:hypothetical protein
MTKTTQDLHSIRESSERLFALKLNMIDSGGKVWGRDPVATPHPQRR